MSDVLSDNEQVKAFAEVVLKNLSGNGFPMKKVSLPLEKLYEAAENKGISFNKVLESKMSDSERQELMEKAKQMFGSNDSKD